MVQRLRWLTWEAVYWLPAWTLAFLWRSLMFRTKFIAVTGSFGKTAAKDCLAAILARCAPSVSTRGNSNGRAGIIQTIFKVRPWHRYAVIEAGTEKPGNLWRASLLIRPDVAVILGVGRAHTQSLRTLEAVAAEKARMLRFLRRGGIAVLNGDDPNVAPMAAKVRGRVLTFGSGPRHDLRWLDASSIWPERLSFAVEYCGEKTKVVTQMLGVHRVGSVAGAIAGAMAAGAGLAEAVEAVREVKPYTARLEPAELPCGAVVLRDEFNASIDSFRAAVEVLREARAGRRILIISDCSDWNKMPRERMRYYARTAKRCADAVVFLGKRAEYGVSYALREGMPEGAARGFMRWEQAAVFLRGELRKGDLVLLRGLNCEHLSRLYFSLMGTIECHLERCQIHRPCDTCPKLGFVPDMAAPRITACAE
ncbi:MAG: hypothetical protein K6T61_16020 [Bryobacteraceae bacterium]|nr:hypothetical protein [Bryobacteraceae bacterium]